MLIVPCHQRPPPLAPGVLSAPPPPLGCSPRARSGSPVVVGGPGGLQGPVELTVTNLDPARHPRDLEKTLYELASRHTKVGASAEGGTLFGYLSLSLT